MIEQELVGVFNGYEDTLRRKESIKTIFLYVNKRAKPIRKEQKEFKNIRIKKHFLNAHGFPKSMAFQSLWL